MKNELHNQITAERIKSKTSDAAITKSFRLDEIIERLKGKPGRKRQPRKREEDGIDYAPEVDDPYEDTDVEGLSNLEDYVPPQGEKQIPQGLPGYEDPPNYDDLSIALPRDEEDEDEEVDEEEGEVDEQVEKADESLVDLGLTPYKEVEKKLDEPRVSATKKTFSEKNSKKQIREKGKLLI